MNTTRKTPTFKYDEKAERAAEEMCKRLSQNQNFRTLGDELSGHDSSMIMVGLKEAGGHDHNPGKPPETK